MNTDRRRAWGQRSRRAEGKSSALLPPCPSGVHYEPQFIMDLRPASETTMKQPATTLLVRDVSSPATEFTVEVVSDYQAFLDLEPGWNNLLQGAGIDHPFLTHEWVRTWWQSFGSGKTLHIIAVQRRGKLVAIAPMMLSKERIYGLNVRLLEFIYNKYTERFDFIVARDAPESYRQI